MKDLEGKKEEGYGSWALYVHKYVLTKLCMGWLSGSWIYRSGSVTSFGNKIISNSVRQFCNIKTL